MSKPGSILMSAEERVREILGISPNLPSQTVIDALVAAAHALERNNSAAAERALTVPGFLDASRPDDHAAGAFPGSADRQSGDDVRQPISVSGGRYPLR